MFSFMLFKIDFAVWIRPKDWRIVAENAYYDGRYAMIQCGPFRICWCPDWF